MCTEKTLTCTYLLIKHALIYLLGEQTHMWFRWQIEKGFQYVNEHYSVNVKVIAPHLTIQKSIYSMSEFVGTGKNVMKEKLSAEFL